MAKYLGPASVFVVNGKEYVPGQSVPLSEASRRHHEIHGHRFDDSADPEPIVPTVEAAPLMVPMSSTLSPEESGAPTVPSATPTVAPNAS